MQVGMQVSRSLRITNEQGDTQTWRRYRADRRRRMLAQALDDSATIGQTRCIIQTTGGGIRGSIISTVLSAARIHWSIAHSGRRRQR